MSVAISATILLLIGSTIIARAATIEEVARCRAIQIKKQQWDCFKSLKAPKQNATRQSQTEDVPKVQTKDVPKVKTEDVPKVQTEDVPKVQTEDVPKVQDGGRSEGANGRTLEGADGGRSEGESQAPQVPLRSLQAASDDPASTSSIDRLNVAAGQPVCVDQDALAAAFFAAVVIGARLEQIASYGCHMIPNDAQVEILQRFPSGFQFLRLVKVNVTSPSQPDATVGYTFEISR